MRSIHPEKLAIKRIFIKRMGFKQMWI